MNDAFLPSKSRESTLAVIIGRQGFQFAIRHNPTQTFHIVRSLSLLKPVTGDVLVRQVREWFMTEDWLQQKFQHSTVAIANSFQVLFPQTFNNPEMIKSVCQFSFNLEGDYEYHVDELVDREVANAWCVKADLINVVREMLGRPEITHASTGFLNAVLEMNPEKQKGGNFLAVNVFINQLELAFCKNGKLVFQNIFDFETPEDFTYYILMVCENFQLNPEKLNVLVFGDVMEDAGYCEMASQYLGKLSFGTKPAGHQYSNELSFVPDHSFFSLYNLFK